MGGTARCLIASRPICGREVFCLLDNGPWTIDHSQRFIVDGQTMEARMRDRLNEIEKTALDALNAVKDPDALEAWRIANVGRSSPLMQVFAELGKLSREERPAVGAASNRV